MSTATLRNDLVTGQFRFEKNHGVEELTRIAQEFKDGAEGSKIKFLAVRSCAEDKYAIAFVYQTDGTKRSFDKFVYKVTDQMKRRFGNEVHWDITSEIWIIE